MLDKKRLERQNLAFDKWRKNKAIGVIEAVTGFGKTFIAIMAVQFMNKKYSERTAIVVVPTTKLLEDWIGHYERDENNNKIFIEGHISKWQLKNVNVFVVNTFVKSDLWTCDLLILDEIHRYSNEDTQQFSRVLKITKCSFILGLSATVNSKQKEFLLKHSLPVVDTIDEIEAERNGYVAPAIIYNLGLKLSSEDEKFNKDINDTFNYYFAKFDHEFDLVKACNVGKDVYVSVRLKNGYYVGKKTGKEWIDYVSKKNGFNGHPDHAYHPNNVAKYAAQCMNAMRKRKNKWQNFPQKIQVAVDIFKKFNVPTIAFAETSDFADKLVEALPNDAVAYHTNLETIEINGKKYGKTKRKALALKEFEEGRKNLLSTVRALDEGFDVQKIKLVLMMAYNSTKRQDIQRKGRGIRIDYNDLSKKTIIINLYMIGTQEEKWVKEKQKGSRGVRWITSINEINMNSGIKLSSNENESPIKIGINSDIV